MFCVDGVGVFSCGLGVVFVFFVLLLGLRLLVVLFVCVFVCVCSLFCRCGGKGRVLFSMFVVLFVGFRVRVFLCVLCVLRCWFC